MAINSLSASSYGLSGLVSGMNTQEMVEKMLSGTKSKIVSQQQKKAQLEYKQELYRGLATQLRSLQSSFFSFSNPTQNLLSSTFFNSMSAKTDSKYFHASATNSASTGTASVDYIKQLAKAATLTGKTNVSGKLTSLFEKNGTTATRAEIQDIIKNGLSDFKNAIKGEITFSIDGPNGVKEVAKLASSDLISLAGLSDDDAAKKLNQMLAGKNAGITVDAVNGKFTFKTTGSNETLLIKTDETAKGLFGFSSTAVSGAGSITTSVDTRKMLPSFQVKLDSQESKTVYFDLEKYIKNGLDPSKALAKSLNEGLKQAFGDAITVSEGQDANGDPNGQISFNMTDKSRQFVITGKTEVMNLLGIKSGQSNKMTLGMRLDQDNFATTLEGNEFKFTINGVAFNITSDTTLNSLISTINNSAAGVNLSYNPTNDKFTLTSSVSGTGSDITITQEQGNLMTALFGIEGNTQVAGNTLVKPTGANAQITGGTSFNLSDMEAGGRIAFDVIAPDGTRRQVSFSLSSLDAGKHYKDKDEFVKALNESIKNNEEAKLVNAKFVANSDGSISIQADAGTKIMASAGAGTLLAKLGFTNGQTNGLTKDSKLTDLNLDLSSFGITATIGGTDVSLNTSGLNADSTFDDLIKAINQQFGTIQAEWDEKDSQIVFTGGAGGNKIKFTGTAAVLSREALFNAQTSANALEAQKTKGQNAILSINGNLVERSDNGFTYDGVSYTLTQTFDGRQKQTVGDKDFYKLLDMKLKNEEVFVDEDGYYRDIHGNYYDPNSDDWEALTGTDKSKYRQIDGTETYVYDERAGSVDVTRDTEQIYNGIVKFVDEYNKIIENIHSLLVEDPDYKDYLPLTEEQKAAMSDREIELWEEKSKKGLLRGDSTLNTIWNDLRSTIYRKPTDSDIAIYNIGITTSGSTEYGGQLVINHSKLKEAIASDADAISRMFTDSVDGVATALNEAINRAAKNSSASPGRLVSMAGTSKSDTSSTLYKQMKAIDDNLDTLEDRYNSEYNRYWKQFNAMEQMIQQMNQQSSWLAQQFAS